MSQVQTSSTLSESIRGDVSSPPEIFLNSDMIGKVCILSTDNTTSVTADNDASSDVIHSSLPNLSPLHVSHPKSSSDKQQQPRKHQLCNRHTVCYSNASLISGHTSRGCRSINAYCSPKTERKQRPGSISTRDLSCLRAECYLKHKTHNVTGTGNRQRFDSANSVDSDHGTIDSASHISTCATSDYAYLTSIDTIAMLCKECQKCSSSNNKSEIQMENETFFIPGLSELDLMSSMRRTYSNPENCQLKDVLSSDAHIRDSRSCSELNEAFQQSSSAEVKTNSYKKRLDDNNGDVPHLIACEDSQQNKAVFTNDQMRSRNAHLENNENGEASKRCLQSAGNKQYKKSIAISEENLVSRVSRWLSTVDHSSSDVLETDVF